MRHAPAPSIRGFAMLSGIESVARGILISVFPLIMYRVFLDAAIVSKIYFLIGFGSLISGLMVPWFTRFIPRRWMFTIGALLFVSSTVFAIKGGQTFTALALLFNTVGTVTIFVCFNAYVLDYVAKVELGRCETLRMFYSALAWCGGPVCGVWLLSWWEPAPFIVSAVAMITFLTIFWILRLGNGKLITKAKGPAPNPFFFLRQFFSQPRLVAGWIFAVLRSCGWWVYVVYLPIYAVENGLNEQTGGIALSLTNGMLFSTPLMLRWMQRHSVRHAVRIGFFASGAAYIMATLTAVFPWPTVALLFLGSVFLILLDICGGLPFLLAVKPSERTEMSAIYSGYRDVSGILSPGVAWLVLLIAPLSGVFAVAGAGLIAAGVVAGKLHPRLGMNRIRHS